MPHPLVIVNGSFWVEILSIIKGTIARFALEDGMDDAQVHELLAEYVQVIEGAREEIFIATARDITKYLNFYKVYPTEGAHDEFKGIYFTGMAVSRFLVRLGLTDLNKLHLRAVLRLLDFRLEYPHRVRRPKLTERIRSLIDSGDKEMQDHLGIYGWYMIYKCLYNSASDRAKDIL